MSPLYSLSGIRQRYAGRLALDLPSLSIEEGSIVGVAGPNGSGKSTLMRMLAFLEMPQEGQIRFDGTSIDASSGGSRAAMLRKHVTLLTQEPYLLRRTVAENVGYGLAVRGQRNSADAVRQALADVGLPAQEFMHRQWFELSGGEAQRVALAARIILRPKVLLMDEPTSSLDEESAERIRMASMRMRDAHGTTLVIVSHDREWLDSVTDTMVMLRNGHLAG